jgi:hypothetical protein
VPEPDSIERRIGIGWAMALALFTAVLFLPLSIWGLPWHWSLLIVLLVTAGLFEAKRRWDFDLWDLWWLWWWWW